MEREVLERQILAGATLEDMAQALGRDRSTIRRWLRRHGLETERMARLRAAAEARAEGRGVMSGRCAVHGHVELRQDARGTFRCPSCSSDRVVAHRRRVKQALIAEAGGRCRLCGYDRCVRALEFHHVDPGAKSFGIAWQGVAVSLTRARAEARKCVLLCANCHAEVEAGLTPLP